MINPNVQDAHGKCFRVVLLIRPEPIALSLPRIDLSSPSQTINRELLIRMPNKSFNKFSLLNILTMRNAKIKKNNSISSDSIIHCCSPGICRIVTLVIGLESAYQPLNGRHL